MSGIQQLLLGGSPAGYQIERSLRFNSADSAELSRTFGTPTNNKIFTISAWVKTTNPSVGLLDFSLLSVGDAGIIGIAGSGGFGATYNNRIFIRNGGSTGDYWLPLLRDVSAWYHFVIAIDTTQATQADRAKLWINGVSQASNKGASTLSLNATMSVNAASTAHYIGGRNAASYYSNGYLTEYNFIDGQALTPSDFGETDSATGVWKPKKFSGTYGTNGFYLNFSDNSNTTSTTLGKDYSGNGNNWTPNLFSVTAGAGNDSLVDTPTSYGTDTGVGGEVRGNYATWNPLDKDDGITSVTEGNLKVVTNGSNGSIKSTIAFPSGKWYWEVTSDSINASGTQAVGIMPQSQPPTNNMSDSGKLGYALDVSNSDRKFENGTATSYGTYTQANGAIYMLAFDQDAGKLWYGIDGTWLASGAPASGTNPSSSSISTTTAYCAAVSDNTVSGTFTVNFGNRAFAYTAPSGYKALCTQNLPTPTIGATSTTQAGKYFNTVLLSGNGSAGSVTGVGFQPDFIWAKNRTNAYNHELWDAIRGVNSTLFSNSTAAEDTTANRLVSFNSDGFSYGTSSNLYVNATNSVAWNWNAGGSNATNTSGTITSTVRANTTAGFSIVTYTGTGANATVGHGLGVAPKMVIVKDRVNGTGYNWNVYHASIGNTQRLFLDSNSGQAAGVWNNTSPTSSVFSLGTNAAVNALNDTYVAYVFAEVAGYSAFGSYTGNGSSDGPFVYTGFRPRFVMIKSTTSADSWVMLDTSRDTYNVANKLLYPNLSNSEATFNSLDFNSNGFKQRNTDTAQNANGSTYIYAAFAESPFKYSLAR